MELRDEFVIDAPIQTLWEVLTDIQRIAPCVPGFELTEIAGDEYRGTMKVKVGAVNMGYDTTVRFLERHADRFEAVVQAEGREQRGPGGVSATITSKLHEQEGKTAVVMTTSLAVTGRIAQFGRGIMADISQRLVAQFVDCLQERVLSGVQPAGVAAPTVAPGAASGVDAERAAKVSHGGPHEAGPWTRPVDAESSEPLNLAALAAVPVAKRILIIAAALVPTVVILRRAGRRYSGADRRAQ
jgi:hypothetical protein